MSEIYVSVFAFGHTWPLRRAKVEGGAPAFPAGGTSERTGDRTIASYLAVVPPEMIPFRATAASCQLVVGGLLLASSQNADPVSWQQG